MPNAHIQRNVRSQILTMNKHIFFFAGITIALASIITCVIGISQLQPENTLGIFVLLCIAIIGGVLGSACILIWYLIFLKEILKIGEKPCLETK